MALSAEPARKSAYSDDLRWRVVWQRIQEKYFREIATNLNLSFGTVHNIWQKFEVTGDISKKIPAERERFLEEHHEMLILWILTTHPDMYLSELSSYIHSETGTVVSNSTICRLLKRHGYSRKKTETQYAVGYVLRGITPVRKHLLTNTRRISCIAAIFLMEFLLCNNSDILLTLKYFFEFVRGSPLPTLQPFDGKNSHSVVMDYFSIHNVNEVEELFREAGVLLLFLPPYSPDLTPIELLFSKV